MTKLTDYNISATTLISIILLILSILLCVLVKISVPESIIISILSFITPEIVMRAIKFEKIEKQLDVINIMLQKHRDSTISSTKDINETIMQIKQIMEINTQHKNTHPYFANLSKIKLDNAINDIRKLIGDGVHHTSPHNSDTFGIEGIKQTAYRGKIQATSVVPDYWEDPFVDEYLKTQEHLIKSNNITIQRIFIFPEGRYEEIKPMMSRQKNIGIDVRYIYTNSEYVNPDYLKEDYLIQDNSILVQIFCDSHKEKSTNNDTEYITTNKTDIAEMSRHFEVLYNRSTAF